MSDGTYHPRAALADVLGVSRRVLAQAMEPPESVASRVLPDGRRAWSLTEVEARLEALGILHRPRGEKAQAPRWYTKHLKPEAPAPVRPK
jgi:hypothetical protein